MFGGMTGGVSGNSWSRKSAILNESVMIDGGLLSSVEET